MNKLSAVLTLFANTIKEVQVASNMRIIFSGNQNNYIRSEEITIIMIKHTEASQSCGCRPAFFNLIPFILSGGFLLNPSHWPSRSTQKTIFELWVFLNTEQANTFSYMVKPNDFKSLHPYDHERIGILYKSEREAVA